MTDAGKTQAAGEGSPQGYGLMEIEFFCGDRVLLENGTLAEVLELIAQLSDVTAVGLDCGYVLALPDGTGLCGSGIGRWLSQHFGRKQQEEKYHEKS